jgi:ankyrin repeat protein
MESNLDEAMISAASNGDFDAVLACLAAGAKVSAVDWSGVSAFARAVRRGHHEMVNALLAAGASVNLADNHGYTPLMWASRHSSGSLLPVLFEAGAHVNLADDGGRTALMWAVIVGSTKVVQPLADAGASVDDVDTLDRSAIYWAVANLRPGCLKLLLQCAADPLGVSGPNTGNPVFGAAIHAAEDSAEDFALISLLASGKMSPMCQEDGTWG